MSERCDPLLDAATRVAQHGSVDWQRELAEAADEQRPALANLRRLEALVAAFQRVGREETAPGGPIAAAPGDPEPLFVWGHLEARESLAAGSFGEVYRAFDPTLQRDVALKLRRRDAGEASEDTDTFIDEARRLARVRHPNVLAVHGADVHEGRVGLWADLLVGRTLEETAVVEGSLPVERALEIASAIASALAAVHEAGLVHGDVKGSNVMLEDDGRAVLMDFGAGIDAGARRGGAVAGSPLYMAPERFHGGTSSASDVYSLGILLHRILAGRLPVEADSIDELVRLHAQRAERPAAVPIAAPRSLRRLLAEMLDPRPERRPSAAATVERVRWIQEAPARRRRRAAGVAIVASLAVGGMAAAVGYFNAKRSEARALEAQEESAAVNDFLRDLLGSPRPTQAGREVRVVDVLAEASEALELRFAGQPHARAATRLLVGRTYQALAEPATAEPLLRRAIEEYEALVGPDADETLLAMAWLGFALADREHVDDATALLNEARRRADRRPAGAAVRIEIYRALYLAALHREQFEEAERWLENALLLYEEGSVGDEAVRLSAQLDLVALLNERGEWRRAEALAREVLAASQRYHGERHGDTLGARHNLAHSLDRQGRYAESGPLFERNYETAREWLGETDPYTLTALGGVASNLTLQGRGADAQRHLERQVGLAHERYGPDHASSLVAATNLATQLRDNGDPVAAEALVREVLERVVRTQGPRDGLAHINRFNLAELLFKVGRYREAEATARAARAEMAASVGEDHLFTLVTDAILGASLAHQGDPAGEQLLRSTLARETELLGENHPNRLEAQALLAGTLRHRGEAAAAVEMLEDVRRRRTQSLGATHPQTVESSRRLAAWRGETAGSPAE